MGRLSRFTKRTLRGQVISYFYLIMLMSIIATVITWGLIALSFYFSIQNQSVNPANYYERQIPDLVSFVHEQKNILDDENKDMIDSVIPLEGMDYQVINKEGNIEYGSMSKPYITSEMELINQLNTNLYDEGKIIRYYPIFNDMGNLVGAIGFRYELSIMSANPQSLFPILVRLGIAFVSPFFYFHLFSYVMGKRLSKKIERPFNEIIEGALKIQHHDLDFSLSHIKSTQELNELVSAFDEMKEALKASLHRQWKLEEDRKDMVTAIAHDLKTPLTIIQGHVEGLLEMKTYHPERYEQYLQTILSSCQRSIQLINELSDVSTLENPEFNMEIRQTNIRTLIESKIREYKLLCDPKDITLETDIYNPHNGTNEVWIDPYRINQVLDNILTNSIRYTPPNGVITWKTTITEQEFIIEIADNGPGFLNENTSKIFRKFYRDDTSRNSEGGHSGLGLFIAHMIVKKHHGEILAQNREEGGAYLKVIIKNMKEKTV